MSSKLLILLVRDVSKHGCAVFQPLISREIEMCGAVPHTPYALRGAMLARTAGASDTPVTGARTPMTEPAERAVLTDDGEELRLTLYSGAGRAAVVVLSPLRAIVLTGDLIRGAYSASDERGR